VALSRLIHQEFGVELGVGVFFDHPTLAELGSVLVQAVDGRDRH
jgi:hypothetical protein